MMRQAKLNPETLSAFDGVRSRVKAAVAAQPQSVSLAKALAQVQGTQAETGTKQSTASKGRK